MITCYLRYTIDPYQLAAFERYSRLILPPAVAAGCASSRRSPTPRVADRILAHQARAPGSPTTPAVPA